MTMIIDGSNGATFPDSSVQAVAGKILQVVNGSYSTATSTTSSTYANTGLSVTITPKSATSKILVICNSTIYVGPSGWCALQVLRNGGNAYSPYSSIGYKNDSYGISFPVAFNYVDSPTTTSALTYTLQFNSANAGVNITIQNDNRASTMVLMEIAA